MFLQQLHDQTEQVTMSQQMKKTDWMCVPVLTEEKKDQETWWLLILEADRL